MLALILILALSETVTTDDVIGATPQMGPENTENRAEVEDYEDTEFHIAHVKDLFARRANCEGETFEERIAKYKRTLQNDAALVKYVSANAIEVSASDVLSNDTCKVRNITEFYIKPKSFNKTEDKASSNGTDKLQGRRASEYQFSHEEYYDEEAVFDETVCPDAMYVIELELDHLRPYDVECGLTLEWRSLD